MRSPHHDEGPLSPHDTGSSDLWGIAGLVIVIGSVCAAGILVLLKF